MRLDNRTREIVIAGEAFHSDAESKAVREYFESTGGLLEAYEGGVKVAYPNREMAEKVGHLSIILFVEYPYADGHPLGPGNGHQGDSRVERQVLRDVVHRSQPAEYEYQWLSRARGGDGRGGTAGRA